MSTNINIIDIECTCDNGHSNPNSEIIEIGLVIVNTLNLEITNKVSIIVKPTTQKISSYCTSLTTITQEMVDKGDTFTEACKILRKNFASTDRTWGSWGNFDKYTFEDQCERENIPYPFGHVTHINIKNLFKLAFILNKECDMIEALRILNIKPIGTHHRGIFDAYNISIIFIELLKRLQKE